MTREELAEKVRQVGEEAFKAGYTDAAVTLGTLVNAIRQGKEGRVANAVADLAVRDGEDNGDNAESE